MEQRPDSPDPAVLSAGTDPTHIPGIDTVVAEPEQSSAEQAGAEPDAAEQAEAKPTDASRDAAADAESDALHDARDGIDTDTDTDDEEEEPPEGPAFEVRDHRSLIVADGNGVLFRLDDTEARFRWSEIGAVEIGDSRFGRRFEIAVCTTDSRRFDAEVIATSRKQRQEWAQKLDAVLDAWFEDGEE